MTYELLQQEASELINPSLIAKTCNYVNTQDSQDSQQPRSQRFSFQKWEGREKALPSVGHVVILNIHCSTVCIPVVSPAFLLVEGLAL